MRRILCLAQHTSTRNVSPRLVSLRSYATTTKYGQPVHETHPHILQPGELTRGITALEYHQRRTRLVEKLDDGGVAILPSATLKTRSGPVFYEFHQKSDFFYLTGFNEPSSLAVIAKDSSELGYKFHLFLRPKDARVEAWDGPRTGLQGAQDIFNADEAHDISLLPKLLPSLLRPNSKLYLNSPSDPSPKQTPWQKFLHGSPKPTPLQSLVPSSKLEPLRPIINSLRVVKSEAEVKNMRRAGQISARGFTKSMAERYTFEKDLWNDLAYGFKKGGCEMEAYVPVVAGGKNGLGIHYTHNDDILRDGEMVLVDAGGQYGNYITDITRTWPVNGRFTTAQKDLYNVVLDVQRKCIALCSESAGMTLDQLHRTAEQGLYEGLKSLGFDMSGDSLEHLFPHHVGHHIGLDVHDAPGYSRTEILKECNCVTIEPGLYIPDDKRWPNAFRGMAVRIEDSICVTKEHAYVLSTEAVKEIDDIVGLTND